jgi:anthranilate phosphoribosyltransferase
MDEISLSARTHVSEVRGGSITSYDLSPEVLGLAAARPEDLQIDTVRRSAEAIRSVLAGARGPRRDVVLANAGAAVYVAGLAADIHEGLKRAAESIDSGAAAGVLESLVRLSRATA